MHTFCAVAHLFAAPLSNLFIVFFSAVHVDGWILKPNWDSFSLNYSRMQKSPDQHNEPKPSQIKGYQVHTVFIRKTSGNLIRVCENLIKFSPRYCLCCCLYSVKVYCVWLRVCACRVNEKNSWENNREQTTNVIFIYSFFLNPFLLLARSL